MPRLGRTPLLERQRRDDKRRPMPCPDYAGVNAVRKQLDAAAPDRDNLRGVSRRFGPGRTL